MALKMIIFPLFARKAFCIDQTSKQNYSTDAPEALLRHEIVKNVCESELMAKKTATRCKIT